MKTIAVILISLLSVTNNSCLKKFELIGATSQKWTGGRQETGFGTYYELTIVPNTNSDNLIFDKLWIGKRYFDVQSFQKGKKMRNNLFAKGDTITIRVNKDEVHKRMPFEIKPENEDKEKCLTEKHPVPKEYEGEALLSYIFKGKRKYFEIKHFTVLEPVYYP